MHVVLVSRLSGSGGIAVYNRTLASSLSKLGHRVTIVTSGNSPNELPEGNQNQIITHHLPVKHRYWLHQLPIIGRYMRSLVDLLYSFRVAVRLRQLDQKWPIDVIEFADVGGEAFVFQHFQKRIPVVVRCHTPTFILERYNLAQRMPYDTSLTTAMEKYSIRNADALTAPSRDMAQTVAAICGIQPDSIQTIPNALEIERFASIDQCQRMNNDSECIILHVGRLERIKGIEILAEAIPLVLQQLPDTRFVFVGAARSDAASHLWKQRLNHAGGQQVSLLGFLSDSEMIEWYRKADIAVVPSLNYESFSYTVAQAMAAGVPVVASRIGGIPETMHDGAGLLFEPGNAADCADALIALARDKSLRRHMGAVGMERAKRDFHAEVVAQKMLEVYRSAITCSSTQ